MRKQSMMGSSKFEFNPYLLDEREAKRTEVYNAAFNRVWREIESILFDYADGDIVSVDGLREGICKRIAEKCIELR